MAALRFNTFLLLSLLIIMPFSSGMVDGFQDFMQAKYYSLEQMKGGNGMIQMSSSRKLLMGAMLDYDDPSANTKHDHDPRKKPGKP